MRSSSTRALLPSPEVVVVVLLPQEAGVRGEDVAARGQARGACQSPSARSSLSVEIKELSMKLHMLKH
jgi:hypothetical protein